MSYLSEKVPAKKVSVETIRQMKMDKQKIAALTGYDYLMAKLLDNSGMDLILIGDSAGNVFAGYDTTLPVTIDEMMYHTRAVRNGVKRALVVLDMPFMSYQCGIDEAVKNAGAFIKAGAEAVKLEGGRPIADVIKRLVDIGIPVMGHLGLTPQSIRQFGNYALRGKQKNERKLILEDAKILEQAGVFSMVLEKIPEDLAKEVSESISVPTIGIGAGKHCDGQILVTHDMLGMNEDFQPKFLRKYANFAFEMKNAFTNYIDDVKKGDFPDDSESYTQPEQK